MAGPSNLQPLAIISRANEEAETKLNVLRRCIKAQEDLAHKLRKESQRKKEFCSFISNNNLRLEAEIRNAELEIKSLLNALSTIESANVELKKELVLSKRNNIDIVEQIQRGEKKYEERWLQSKSRYESITFVQEWLQAVNKSETLKDNIKTLDNEVKILHKDIKMKKALLLEMDRRRIIQLAEFFIHEMPGSIKIIKEKSAEINELTNEIETLVKEQKSKKIELPTADTSFAKLNLPQLKDVDIGNTVDNQWANLCGDNYDMMMPNLKLANAESDVFISIKFELMKIVPLQARPGSPLQKRSDYAAELDANTSKRVKIDRQLNNDYISSYFNKPTGLVVIDDEKENVENYSQRKLINILEDIKLDKNETINMVSKVNPDKLYEVNAIGARVSNINETAENTKNMVGSPLETDEIEEIDLTKSNSQNILFPPTQFMDLTEENTIRSSQQNVEVIVHMSMEETPPRKNNRRQLTSSQENIKKRVSFDIPMSVEEVADDVITKDDVNNESTIQNETIETINTNESINCQTQEATPSVSDENYTKIKDMILKKHQLDLSPQFVYAKNLLQKRNEEEKVVTSKFFDNTKQLITDPDEDQAKITIAVDDNKRVIEPTIEKEKSPVCDMEVEVASSPRADDTAKPVTGLLFTHGPQALPESLDVSMNTTGLEDGLGDYPHCLDSSLLLSPKADMQPSSGNQVGGSQEVVNFLSGFKKTGLFFFGQTPPPEGETHSNAQNQENNFNFNFNSQEKKTKGGLFSFFR